MCLSFGSIFRRLSCLDRGAIGKSVFVEDLSVCTLFLLLVLICCLADSFLRELDCLLLTVDRFREILPPADGVGGPPVFFLLTGLKVSSMLESVPGLILSFCERSLMFLFASFC